MGMKQTFLLSVAVLFLLSLCYLIVFSDHGLRELKYLERQRDKLSEENDAIVQDNIALYRRVDRLKHDLSYIESVVRNELGVIGKDEIILKLKE
jgi:cell division protein FtsB